MIPCGLDRPLRPLVFWAFTAHMWLEIHITLPSNDQRDQPSGDARGRSSFGIR